MVSKKFLYDIDLGKNSLLNAVLQNLSSAPASPVPGQVYYDTTQGQVGFYQSGAWVYVSVAQSNAAIQALVAAMFTGASQSVITSTYDSTGKLVNQSIASGAVTNTMIASGLNSDKLIDGSTNGVYTLTERAKLAGIASGATNYTDTNARANRLDQFAAPTASVSFGSQRIISLADPTGTQDAATKNYVDTGLASNATADRNRANHTGTQTSSTISDFTTSVRTNKVTDLAAPTTSFSMNGQTITSLGTPVNATDAATKGYVDNVAAGFDPKGSVAAATTANITLSGLQSIDGYTTVAGDRILVKNQTTASANGIYVAASGAWTRSTDANTSALVTTGMMTYVEQGSTNAGQLWILTTTGTITLGTTALSFTQFSGASVLTAGAGLAAAGNVFNVGQGTGIVVSADSIAIDSSVVTQKAAATIGDGSATSIAVTHNLGTKDVTYSVRQVSDDSFVEAYAVATSTNVLTFTFNTAPATGSLRVTVHG